MSLKAKYFTLIILLHVALTVLLYLFLQDNKWWFVLSELFILISLTISIRLFKTINYPFQLLKSGKDTMSEEDFTIKFNETGTKELDDLIVVYNRMIDQLRKEKTRTEEQSYFLEDLIENSPLGMLIMDYDRKIVIANQKVKQILEDGDLINKQLETIDHPLAAEIAKMEIFQEQIIAIDGLHKYKCKLHQLIHKGFPRQFVIIEELTSDLLEAEKQAYGKVIRMMSHEVNNSMGAVNSILQNVSDFALSEEEDQEYRDYLEIAIERNRKLGKFTDNFAEFIRLAKPLLVKIDLNALLEQLVDYLKLSAGERSIEIDLRTYPEPILVTVDKIQMEQVISNILKNAFEAIGSNGAVRITTQPEKPQLVIADNGEGISDEEASQIFTPFFSTKPDGQGIGLMLIRDILNNHQAEYRLYTDQGDGWTKFEVGF
ncbi:sensor histidine kinase [Portibacter marinus]|uniref:sensor histidine kinase n=1 Tax=Portibacter marinus TaxID=2898660 RepID=UPI001F3C897B|nr:ATP-binding protein [Portibacter marinus]